jgi:hypothetical protein
MAISQIATHPVATSPKASFRCPKCGSTEAYRSQRRNWQEKLTCWFQGVLPYRCRKCDMRFYSRKPSN